VLNKKTDDVKEPNNLKGDNHEHEAQILKIKLQLRKLFDNFARSSRTSRNGMQRLCDVQPLSELRRGLGRLASLGGLRDD